MAVVLHGIQRWRWCCVAGAIDLWHRTTVPRHNLREQAFALFCAAGIFLRTAYSLGCDCYPPLLLLQLLPAVYSPPPHPERQKVMLDCMCESMRARADVLGTPTITLR